VPVDEVDGTAFVSFTDANRYLAKNPVGGELFSLRQAPGNGLTVVIHLTKGGKPLAFKGIGSVSVASNVVSVSIGAIAGSNCGRCQIVPPSPLTFPLQDLPFQIRLRSVSITAAGISAVGSASHIVLGSH
jgi:LmeA-like phospholipid-binding